MKGVNILSAILWLPRDEGTPSASTHSSRVLSVSFGLMERYVDAWRYVSRQFPIPELQFDVTVAVSPTTDELQRHIVARCRVGWGHKIYSPADLVRMVSPTAVAASPPNARPADAPTTAYHEQVLTMLKGVPGDTVQDKVAAYLSRSDPSASRPSDQTVADSAGDAANQQQAGTASVRSSQAANISITSSGGAFLGSATMRGGLDQFGWSYHIYSHVAHERFYPTAEEVSESLPPQDITPLHRLQLRRAAGLEDDDGSSAMAGGGSMHLMVAIGRPPSASQAAASQVVWEGTPHVLMTLRSFSEGQLVAAPSLHEWHVLHVNDTQMVSFCVVPNQKHRGGGRRGAGALESAVTSSANVLTASVTSPLRSSVASPGPAAESLASDPQDDGLVLLRQALAGLPGAGNVRGAGAASAGTTSRSKNASRSRSPHHKGATVAAQQAASIQAPSFTPVPSAAGRVRVSYFIVLEQLQGFDRDACSVECTWVLPPGPQFELDVANNQRCGLGRLDVPVASQTAFAARVTSQYGIHTTTHTVNLPLELHAVTQDDFAPCPKLVFKIVSGGRGTGFEAVEGYGVLSLPPSPGNFKCGVGLWRPAMSGAETLKATFIGGAPSLVDLETVALPYSRIKKSNTEGSAGMRPAERPGASPLAASGSLNRSPPFASGGTLAGSSPPPPPAVAAGFNSRCGLLADSTGHLTVSWSCMTLAKDHHRASAVSSRYERRLAGGLS